MCPPPPPLGTSSLAFCFLLLRNSDPVGSQSSLITNVGCPLDPDGCVNVYWFVREAASVASVTQCVSLAVWPGSAVLTHADRFISCQQIVRGSQ